jgi:phosphatidylserine decarboxylase
MNRGRLHIAPRCYIRIGERVGQGQRCGFIHLGGQVDLYLPQSSRTLVAPGDWVRSGSDVIAKLIH